MFLISRFGGNNIWLCESQMFLSPAAVVVFVTEGLTLDIIDGRGYISQNAKVGTKPSGTHLSLDHTMKA
jgi:hypothetical protein